MIYIDNNFDQNISDKFINNSVLYAKQEFKIFPCQQDKKPLTRNGFKDATDDVAIVAQWAKSYPEALIGLSCQHNNLVVLDFDNARDESGRTWKNAKEEFEKLFGVDLSNHPYVVQTQRGGRHYYFKSPEEIEIVSASKWRGISNMDVKAIGGYVIAADGVTYKLLNDTAGCNPEQLKDIPELPQQFIVS